jgi:hypothetical protein
MLSSESALPVFAQQLLRQEEWRLNTLVFEVQLDALEDLAARPEAAVPVASRSSMITC